MSIPERYQLLRSTSCYDFRTEHTCSLAHETTPDAPRGPSREERELLGCLRHSRLSIESLLLVRASNV